MQNKPLFTLKPVFLPSQTILTILPIQLFLTLWGAMFFGGFTFMIRQALFPNLPGWSTFAFFGSLFFFGVPFLAFISKKKSYEAINYNFYSDHLEFFEGFITVEEKTIKYSDIKEISLRRGPIQKKHNLGTIVISTPAINMTDKINQSGITIADIKDPKIIYSKIQELVAKSKV
jgi:membrane protein YdbS with pleckstrin-like domain